MDELKKVLIEMIDNYELELNEINNLFQNTYSYKKILDLSTKELIRYLYYFEFKNKYNTLCEISNNISNNMDELSTNEFKIIIENLETILQHKYIETLKTNNPIDKNNIVYEILKKTFTENDIFNNQKYDDFLKLINTDNKKIFMSALYIILTYKDKTNKIKDNKVNEYKTNAINVINFIIKDKKDIIKLYTESYNTKLKVLKRILKKIEEESFINLSNYEKEIIKKTNNAYIILIIIEMYNNILKSNDYYKLKFINEELNNSGITKIDEILHKYNCNINVNDIKISSQELEQYLNDINMYFTNIINNNLILKNIINNIEYKYFKELISLYNNKYITEKFIIDNISLLCSKENVINFFTNINLLLENNINVKKVIKYDSNILFNKDLNNIIDIYNLYEINISKDYTNYEFLKKDYSNIIDKFIEIDEYNLIKEDATLLNKNSNLIIKRCYLYKILGNELIGENNKINGYLRNEEKFLIDDEELEDTIIENYNEFIPKDVIDCLSKENNSPIKIFNLENLKIYKYNDFSYKIDNIIISKYKILNNLNILYENKFNEKYTFEELLLYSMFYNYPILIENNILNNIKQKAKILK